MGNLVAIFLSEMAEEAVIRDMRSGIEGKLVELLAQWVVAFRSSRADNAAKRCGW